MHDVSQNGLRGMRVAVVQQVLPHYRVPLFARLVDYFGVDLTVYADLHPFGSLASVRVNGPFRVVHSPLVRVGPLLFQSAVHDVVRENSYDTVVLSWNARYLQLPFALFRARSRGIPVALWGHGYSKKEGPLRNRYRNWLLKQAYAGITYNRATTEKLVSEGISGEHVFTACNAIDQAPIRAATTSWNNRHDELVNFRNTNDLNPDRTAIFVSRIEKEKGVPFLLKAFTHVLEEIPDATLVLVGEGNELPQIKNQVNKLGLGTHVVCTGPIYQEEELAPWMLSSACLVCPRAVGLSILHGFGYGLPCIASDDLKSHGPEIDALKNGVNGMLYRDGDTRSLAECISACFRGEKELQQRMHAAARSTVSDEGEFSLKSMTQGYAQALMALWHRDFPDKV